MACSIQWTVIGTQNQFPNNFTSCISLACMDMNTTCICDMRVMVRHYRFISMIVIGAICFLEAAGHSAR